MASHQQLLKEIRNDNTEKVLELLEGEENLALHDKKGKSLLHLAIENQNADILEELVKVVDKSELNYQLRSGETPLLYCLDYGFWRGLEILLQNEDVDSSLQDEENMSIIHHATAINSEQALQAIFRFNIDINQQCNQGSILHVAIVNQSTEAALYILENAKKQNLDILSENKEGNTIFQLAVIEGQGSILQESLNYLQKQYPDQLDILNNKNKEGNTLLHEAYKHKREGMIKLLEEQKDTLKLNTTQKNKQGLVAEQIGQKLQQEKKEKEEKETLIKRDLKEQSKQNKERQKQVEREYLEQQEKEKIKEEERQEKMQRIQEQIDKKGKFAFVVLVVVVFAILYLLMKNAATPKTNYID